MSKLNDTKDEKSTNFPLISIIVAIIIMGLWCFAYFTLKDWDYTDRGTFGDMFGSVNALFSGFALAGIIITILLQRQELKFQREELKETRKEFKTQNETLKLQRFENTFFNMLNLHHQIVNSIDHRYYTANRYPMEQRIEEKEVEVITGRDVFRHRYGEMKIELKLHNSEFEKIYLKHYKNAQTDFGHYFRNLYRMIKLVDETPFFYDEETVSENEVFKIKYKYISIIRSQISDYELLWIFYNCLSENGKEKFKPFIEHYCFFKNFPNGLLARQDHKDLYNPQAFDRQK